MLSPDKFEFILPFYIAAIETLSNIIQILFNDSFIYGKNESVFIISNTSKLVDVYFDPDLLGHDLHNDGIPITITWFRAGIYIKRKSTSQVLFP